MKSFVSWSGGKDCTIALHLWIEKYRQEGAEVSALLHMRRPQNVASPSHFVPIHLLERQAQSLGIPLQVEMVAPEEKYEEAFRRALRNFYLQGVEIGIFGDIYLDSHRVWLERVCALEKIEPSFPLWGKTSEEVMEIFLGGKYTSMITSIKHAFSMKEILGSSIDRDFLHCLQEKDPLIDVCGENGEFHSFVVDAPLFSSPISIDRGEVKRDSKYDYLEIG